MDSQENMPEQTQKSLQDNKKSRKKPIIVSIVLILMVAALAFGALWYLKSSQTTTSNENQHPKDIKKLTFADIDSPMNGFFPEDNYIFLDHSYHINNQVAEGLVAYEGMTKVVPRLATSWKNPDESTWVFDLKKGIKFHTGRTMTADDAAYSINKAIDNEGVGILSSTIESSKALSKYQVEIKTKGPDATLLGKLTLIYIFDGSGNYNTATGGTGAYMIKPGTTPTEEKLDLVAFDDYHGGRPQVRALTFKQAKDEADAVNQVKQGKANIAGELTNDGIKGLDKDKIDIRALPSNSILFMTFNVNDASSPLHKKEVRQAIRLATDMSEVIKKAAPDDTTASQVVPQEIPGYNPSIKPTKQNIEKAKQLLADAGYPNGFKTNFTYMTPSHTEIVNVLEKQLAQVGITIDKVEFPISKFDDLLSAIMDGKTGLSIMGYASDTFDGNEVYGGVFKDLTQFESPELDQKIQQAQEEFDESKRLKTLQEIAKYADEQSIIAPILRRTYYWVTDNSSYVFPRDVSNSGTGTYYWKAHLK